MSRVPSRDVSVVLQMGSLLVSWSAEGVAWNPDVADDMANRAMGMFRDALAEVAAYGLLQTDNEITFDDGAMAGADEDGE